MMLGFTLLEFSTHPTSDCYAIFIWVHSKLRKILAFIDRQIASRLFQSKSSYADDIDSVAPCFMA